MSSEQTPLLDEQHVPRQAPTPDSPPSAAPQPTLQPSQSYVSRVVRLFTGPPVCPPGIDPSPRYLPNGDRVFLDQQRAPTFGQIPWVLLLYPITWWRFRHIAKLSPAERLRRGPELEDPSVLVPTYELDSTAQLSSTFDPAVVERRVRELEDRQKRLDKENEVWLKQRAWWRPKRLSSIDRQAKYDPEGKRIFLFAQRDSTPFEQVMSVVTLPYMFYKSWRTFSSAMGKASAEGREMWDQVDLEDPTVVIPTGKSHWLKEELVDEPPAKKEKEMNKQESEVI